MTRNENIESARRMIAEIEHDLTNYEAIGWTQVYAEEAKELGWWRSYLGSLLRSA